MSRVQRYLPALSGTILENSNFFDLYPFDGGGFFVTRSILGTLDDEQIAARIMKEDALRDYGALPALDYCRFERWSTIEKSCWINRMYFIVPLARTAKRRGDLHLASQVKEMILHFARTYPGPRTKEEICTLEREVVTARDRDYNRKGSSFDAPVSYQWFDFQVASRIVNIFHAIYFIREFPVFSGDDWMLLDEMLFHHARLICWSEEDFTALAPGNHQALRGMALLLAAGCFKGMPGTENWAPVAEKICEYHILHDFLPDGMSRDLSPSYHFFECWIARDILLLADREGFRLSEEARARLRLAFMLCRTLQQPDGRSTVISDGYALPLSGFLDSLPEKGAVPPRCVLSSSGLCFYREKEIFLLLDCSPLLNSPSHYHGGKMAPTLFFRGRPFLTDSGCCNYDDPEFAEYYKLSRAHSSLLVDGAGDSVLEGRYAWLHAPVCSVGTWRNGTVECSMRSSAPGWETVQWMRRTEISGSSVIFFDAVRAGRAAEMSFIFNLHPDVTVEKRSDAFILRNHDVCVKASFSVEPEIADALGYEKFARCESRQLICRIKGAGCRHQAAFRLLSDGDGGF